MQVSAIYNKEHEKKITNPSCYHKGKIFKSILITGNSKIQNYPDIKETMLYIKKENSEFKHDTSVFILRPNPVHLTMRLCYFVSRCISLLS